MAAAMLTAGATVILSGRNAEKLRTLLNEELRSLTDRCHVAVGDLATPDGVERLCDEICDRFSVLHGLVNNATDGRVGELRTITAEDFLFAAQHNLVAPFLLVKRLLPLLERGAADAGDASVVNVGTMYGTVSPYPEVYGDSGLNNPIQYGATKAGLMQMTRYLACHLGGDRIRVNSIAPGPFPNTDNESSIDRFYETLAERVPLKRVGKPHEVAYPVVFLLSRAASYINGANIAVDGGWTSW
jgi:NAD(P)-dependent dehydrogenase (short-subunit alcohol dehydrogenase family)